MNNLKQLSLEINSEPPNELLYTFKGSFKLDWSEKSGFLQTNLKENPLSISNILLRGSVLKNTDYMLGLVLYTGHETKIMKGSLKAQAKKSELEHHLNFYLKLVFVFLLLLCATSSILNIIFIKRFKKEMSFMHQNNQHIVKTFFVRMGNWLLVFANLIPISLMVSLELVKFAQGSIIARDKKFKTKEGVFCEVQSSNLNEELGGIEYIFSDKTGTLTCNQMNFKKLIIGGKVFGDNSEESEIDSDSIIFEGSIYMCLNVMSGLNI